MCAARAYRSTALERPNGHGDHVDLGDVLGAMTRRTNWSNTVLRWPRHWPARMSVPGIVRLRYFRDLSQRLQRFGLNPCRSNMERWLVTQGQRIERPSAALSHLSGSLAAY
jgi:hypothetical protein